MASVLKRRDTDMTRGSIPRLLINFAVPVLLGNIFQQLYNAVDSIIVGNYVGKQALAAVGCTGPVINSLIGLFAGLATGAGVVISQFYGAGDREKLRRAVSTAVTMTLIACVVMTVLGLVAVPHLLSFMNTPDDVFPEAAEYLRIFFMGITGMLLYNMGSGILRAVGDSTRPLYFLIFSAALNTVLDVVLVKYLHQGIAGAAYATIASQLVSAVLVLILLIRSREDYRLNVHALRMDGPILRKVCAIGIPSALQMAVTAFSNIFVLSYINQFNSSCMAGWTAYNKIDSFAMLPMMALSMAISTFVGQNIGAKNYRRSRSAPRYGLIMGLIAVTVVIIPLMIFAPSLVRLFNGDKEVIDFGTTFIRMISPFYLSFALNQVYTGALRGAGDTKSSMFITLSSYVVFRQIYLFIVSRLQLGAVAVGLGYPAGWLMGSLLLIIYYYTGKRSRAILEAAKAQEAAAGTKP